MDTFDEKIKLTPETKSKFKDPKDRTKHILSYNRYGQGSYKYKNEKDIIDKFFNWLNEYHPNIVVFQNAIFDMSMLGGRYHHKINSKIFDTKDLIRFQYLPLLQKLAESDTQYQKLISQIGTSDRDGGLLSSSMSKIGPALNINMSGYHDALTDCRITMNMFQKLIEFLKLHQNEDIQKYQTERIKVMRNI